MMNWRLFHPVRDLMPIYARQAQLLGQAAQLLGSMLETQDPAAWKNLYKEIRNLEHQGDAILGEFRSQIAHCILGAGPRRELTTIAMSMDDALDVVKDSANALLIYKPAKIDAQLRDLGSIIHIQAQALKALLPYIENVRKNSTALTLQADRVTELEHDADEAYESYVGYIFEAEPDMREMTKYKNLAELFEKATDSEKHVADCVRILAQRYTR